LDKFNNYWCNNDLAAFVHGESKEDKLVDDFIYVLNSIVSEVGNEISSRLEKDIPQYAGGW